MTKFKPFVGDKFNVTTMMIFDYDSVENIVGKKENAGFQYFLQIYIAVQWQL